MTVLRKWDEPRPVKLRPGADARQLKLNVDQFWHLKKAGAFSRYSKSELLEGELSGVPLRNEDGPESDASVPIKLRVQDYLLLGEAGLLAGNGRTELIDGILYEVSPQHRPHWYAKNELTYRLRRALEKLESALYVGSEGSVFLSEVDLPEPDIVVTSDPAGAGPIPLSSVRLLVEIADTTRNLDLGTKAVLYARRGVPEYWVADVVGEAIRQLWSPTGDAYAERRLVPFGSTISAATIAALGVETSGL